jgi:acetylglutamate kinase
VQKNYEDIYKKALALNADDSKNCQMSVEASLIKDIIHRNSDLKNEVIVIKLPAEIIENDELLSNFVENIKVITDSGAGTIIVHDYTKLVESTLNLFNIDPKFIDDFHVADHKTSQIIEMVLSGYINKRIVSFLCNVGCKTVGISGKDGYLIESRKSLIAQKSCNDIINVGFIGEPIAVNCEILLNFLEADIVTVISPVSFGLNRATHILDADFTAAAIAAELAAKHLIFLTNLGDLSIEGQSLKICSLQKLKRLHQQSIIKPEYARIIQATRKALEHSTKFVYISNSTCLDATLLTIFANQNSTKITL